MSVATVPFQSGDRVSVNNYLFSAGSWYEHCHQQSLYDAFEDYSRQFNAMIKRACRKYIFVTALPDDRCLSKKGPC